MSIQVGHGQFSFITEEHTLIAEAAGKLFADLSSTDEQLRQQKHRRIEHAAVAAALDELGLFGVGSDAMVTAQIQALIAREAGSAALPYPVIEALVTHALVVRAGLDVKSGSLGSGTYATDIDHTTVLPALAGRQLSGTVGRVPFASSASSIWLRVHSDSEADGVSRSLAIFRPSESKATFRVRNSVEPDYLIEDVALKSAPVAHLVAQLDNGSSPRKLLEQRGALLAAAEVSGACRRMVTMTRDYLQTRSQFGQVLGVHQALRHNVSDAYVRVEALITAVDYAAAACDAGAEDADVAVAAAKHFAGRAGKLIADTVLQLHGAIGYTMEFPLHLLMRRVHRLGVSHGSTHRQADLLFKAFEASC